MKLSIINFNLDTMGHLITNCPNIEVLHLTGADLLNNAIVDFPADYNLNLIMSRIRFHKLRQLTLNGFHLFDGSYLTQVSYLIF